MAIEGYFIRLLESPAARQVLGAYIEDHREFLVVITAISGAGYFFLAPLAIEIRCSWHILEDHNAEIRRAQIEEEELGRDLDRWFPQQWGADSD